MRKPTAGPGSLRLLLICLLFIALFLIPGCATPVGVQQLDLKGVEVSSLQAATSAEHPDFFAKNLNGAFPPAAQRQEQELKGTENPTDGSKIITAVGERDRGEDSVISTSWIVTKKGKVIHRMKYNEKRKNYRGKDGFRYKSIIRYTSPPNAGRRGFVVWDYKDGQKNILVSRGWYAHGGENYSC
jgi:hypothetical protein